jgi:hypothetical protein
MNYHNIQKKRNEEKMSGKIVESGLPRLCWAGSQTGLSGRRLAEWRKNALNAWRWTFSVTSI